MPDRSAEIVGARIAKRRHQLDWSQVELAHRLGVSPSTVANWERGASYPKRKLGKVEQVLGISLDGPEPEPDILPDGVRDDIRRGASSPEAAAHLEELFEAFARGEPLPVRKRRAAR